MLPSKYCLLVALLLSGCVIPNVQLVDSLGTDANGAAGASDSGPAVAKFCNTATFNGASIDLRLDIGTGADAVSIQAPTNACRPITGNTCTPIPAGSALPIALVDPSTNTALDSLVIDVSAGQAWVFWADVPEGSGSKPIISADNSYSATQCQADDFADFF